jgi:hypothetical protein
MAMAVLVIALLAALVWALRPEQAKFQPAPLRPLPPGCPKVVAEFVPTNITEVPGVSLESLTKEQKYRVLFQLNMNPCPCGCNVSIAACLFNHPQCEEAKRAAEKIVSEERGEGRIRARTR